jgi:ABC-type nitrate/sulfonate/bicarbonate transport system substrate-binding protein
MRRRSFRILALFLGGAFLVGACTGGGASSAPSVAASAPAATSSAAVASVVPSVAPTEQPGTKTFSVGFTSPGLSTAPYLAALDAMRAAGYTIDTPIIESSELLTQGVAGGQFAFGSGANNSVLAAIEAGANLKVITSRVANEWTLYARTATIKTCADLAGKKLAIHSEGAVSTAMVKNYVQTKCPGTEPSYVVVPGSPNRLAALLADQIDASPLELGDSITIDTKAADRFSLLASLASDLPDLQTTSIYVNGDFAKANPGTVQALVKAVITEYRRVGGDAALLQADAEKYTKDAIDETTVTAAATKYVQLNMFPANGGITKDNLDYTAKFFGPSGTASVKTDFTLDQWADLSYQDAVLAELGTK